MLDGLLGFGSIFDWITPALSFVRGGHRFVCYDAAGMTGREVARLLKRSGLHPHSVQMIWPDDALVFNVPHAEAMMAYRILSEAGIVVDPPKGRER